MTWIYGNKIYNDQFQFYMRASQFIASLKRHLSHILFKRLTYMSILYIYDKTILKRFNEFLRVFISFFF